MEGDSPGKLLLEVTESTFDREDDSSDCNDDEEREGKKAGGRFQNALVERHLCIQGVEGC